MADLVRRESEFLLYTAPDGAVKVGVLFRDETAWLAQRIYRLATVATVPTANLRRALISEPPDGGIAHTPCTPSVNRFGSCQARRAWSRARR